MDTGTWAVRILNAEMIRWAIGKDRSATRGPLSSALAVHRDAGEQLVSVLDRSLDQKLLTDWNGSGLDPRLLEFIARKQPLKSHLSEAAVRQ